MSKLSKIFSNSELKNKDWRPICLKYLKCKNLKIVHNVQNLRIVPMFKISKSFNYLSLRNVYNIQNLQIVHNVQKMSNKIFKLCKSKKSQNLKIVHNVQHLKISNIFHNVKNLEIFKLFLV